MTRTRWRRGLLAIVAAIAVATGPAIVTAGPANAADDPPDTELVVWGNSKADEILTVPGSFQSRSFQQVALPSTATHGGVALDSDGVVRQWGKLVPEDTVPTSDPMKWLGRASEMTALNYGISTDGTPWFWGGSGLSCCDQSIPESLGPVEKLTANKQGAGAVLADGTVALWSNNDLESSEATPYEFPLSDALPEELTDPETAHVKDLVLAGTVAGATATNNYAFAIHDDGSLTPFGWDLYGVLDVPEDLGPVEKVVTFNSRAFAVTEDGEFRQWGNIGSDPWVLPLEEGEKLADISVGANGLLGLTEDGRLIVGTKTQKNADVDELVDNVPWDKLEGRKIISFAASANAYVVVTAAPDPISVVNGPTVAGVAMVGKTLTGTPATFSGGSATIENQWLVDGAPIDGATGTTYVPTLAEADKRISFRSTATLGEDTAVGTSDETAAVADWRAIKTPSIVGVAKVGETLSLGEQPEFSLPVASPSPFNPLKTWNRDGIAVSFSPTYTLTEADEGKIITFVAQTTYEGVPLIMTSDPVGPVVWDGAEVDPMSLDQRASISGTAKVGRELTGTPATFTGEPDSVTNQWFADGVAIDGETGTTYTPVEGDEYKQITFRSTAIRGEETLKSTSNPTDRVQPGKVLLVETEASVSGTAKSGETLTGTPATFNLEEAEVSNRWLADGAPIDGATGNTLELGAAQVDKKISFESTATYDGISVVSVSDETAKVADVDLAKLTDPSISGTAQVTKTLVGTPGTFNAGTVTNQWFANGVAIDGATGTSYTLVEADEDKTITFKSTATRGEDTLSATSAGVGPVLPEILPIEITKDSEITGTAQVGIALTGVPAEFDGDGAVTYQWLVDGAPIDGATGTTYTPVAGDEGKMIAFRTIATSGDISLPSTSDAVGPVLPAAEDPNEEPGGDDTKDKIKVLPDSTFKVGEKIKVDVGEEFAGENVSAFLFSDPFSLGTFKVAANGQISITIPANAPTGAHRLAVYDANGDLIGWQNVLVQLKDGSFGPGGSLGAGGRLLPDTGAGMPGYAVPMGILLVLGGLALAVPARARKLKGAHRLPA